MKFETIDIQNKEGGQAIEIPESFKIDDSKVYIKKMGNCLYIIPYHQPWQSLLDSLQQFSPDFMEERNQPLPQNRESFD
ncbi:MAG TPA: type II toxin-antitoxin system VapB family antitoxin [Hanamia sp.]|jgi:antitoxin VapB